MSLAIAEMPAVDEYDNPFHQLVESFEAERISYCYFRSSLRAPVALAGHSDLDLLIARTDRARAVALLRQCGFRHWPDAAFRQNPAIESYLAYDRETGAIFHVHAHFRLLLGPPLCKTHRLPIEEALLRRSCFQSDIGLRTLDLVDEALLLSVRECLERSWTDPVALKRWKADTEKRRHEVDSLMSVVDRQSLWQRAAEIFDEALATDIVDWFFTDGVSLTASLRRSWRMRRALAPYRIANLLELRVRATAAALTFLFGHLNRRFFALPRATRRRAPGGGVVIALVGVDGSGKSTQCAQLNTWLGAEIDVMSCYFGTGDGRPSLLLAPFKMVAPLIGRAIKTKPKGASHGIISDRPPGPVYSLLFSIWAAAVALDKRRKLALVRRAVARGLVVVTDRYPQNENVAFNDGPLLHRTPSAPEWLKRFEARIYEMAERSPPDLVIKLHVDQDIVARREPDMDKALILSRVSWLKDLNFSGAKIVSIDARAPLADVTKSVRDAVWALL
ncbi:MULTISPECIES: hypothetical protein [unclassified Beijerinckia]|uniref:hypothetical protein n=1 Tax=unclassified Beijerinckia TaxID=2638183 RepID=UPI00089735C6|nr:MULTISPECIES: hypothetical protein [unclassified Beijerinckia]MDH7796987.1 thymidylate kinase [Beijerinckia sp. GAS462]SEC67616.1 hypothetical protein SAMN05443249_3273 [Beijerinckia sp. 28-YEA-48]